MLSFLFSFSLLFIHTQAQQVQVINGTRTKDDAFGFAVRFIQQDYMNGTLNQCTGVIIDKSWILTTAYCLTDINITSIVYNTYDLNDRTYTYDGKFIKKYLHPTYSKPELTKGYNIGLIKLNPPLKDVKPAILNTCASRPILSSTVTVAGWGAINYTSEGANSQVLRSYSSTTMNPAICESRWKNNSFKNCPLCNIVEEKAICAVDGACYGDFGAPLVYKRNDTDVELVGILSYAACLTNFSYPSVYTSVSKYIPWIRKTTNLLLSVNDCFPTEQPTLKPTSQTKSPTVKPSTKSPTVKPTTKSPTVKPTSPTKQPTQKPTVPTQSPTDTPTGTPTVTPTGTPTGTPTVTPTGTPTVPTLTPTVKPTTKSPTVKPTTKSPTRKPTTNTPTRKPTTKSPT